jgi:hypothetical protein
LVAGVPPVIPLRWSEKVDRMHDVLSDGAATTIGLTTLAAPGTEQSYWRTRPVIA